MVWCLCCTILLHKLCQSYVFPAWDLCRDVPIFLWVLLMLKGMRLVFFSVCVCVLMITKRVSFHFHHGKRQVWDVSMLNVADSAHLRPWMQAWILHVFPSRLPVACFFLRDKCHICRVWWWGGKLSTNQERSLNLWRRIYMHETQGTNAGKPSLSVATFLLVLSSIPTSPPKLVSFQNCRGNISTHFATVLGFNGFNSRWCHDGAFSTLQLFALHCVAQIIHRPTTLEW